ncbi:hypothetical protein B9J77_03050 [candidate division NPL-UPA2 bacterium Unc8]|uniref:Uncharacterized protein n=1 Tax=candidate division NPL-UPA2 bacterium Unc8 TaxID=1980939 RepID=A0A399FV67_UNCN2|nr:MAG: hypothetical protein B9J77_03050 [candidate division NPL-UPA2 bacterium Unc8]
MRPDPEFPGASVLPGPGPTTTLTTTTGKTGKGEIIAREVRLGEEGKADVVVGYAKLLYIKAVDLSAHFN